MNFKDKTLFKAVFLAILISVTVITTQVFVRGFEDKSNNDNPRNQELSSHYKAYSKEAVEQANSEGQRIVLFFHANWCPTCRAADTDLIRNSSSLPFDVTVLKVDYDTSKELKSYYSVAYQHTYVQIDNQGNEIAKWVGGGIDDIIKSIKTLACIEGICNQPKV